jgi:hypothetical protein
MKKVASARGVEVNIAKNFSISLTLVSTAVLD